MTATAVTAAPRLLDVILPVFNEEAGIEAFHRELVAVLDALAGRYDYHVIYVLDRSSDRSFDILCRLAGESPRVTVIHLSRRFGHQMSLLAGLDRSSGDAALMMDADLQHPPALIPELLARFEDGYDVVQTVRVYGGDETWFKQQSSTLFYRLQNALSPVEIRDGMADFRLVSRKVVRVFQSSIREQHQFLRGLFQWVGFRRAEVPFVSAPRRAGTTKYHLMRLLAFSVSGIVSFSKVPLRLAAIFGLVFAAAGGVYAIWLLTEYFEHGGFPPGYASLMIVTLVLGGLQLTFLGVLGEYLGGIFDEVKGRPLYIVDEIVGGRS